MIFEYQINVYRFGRLIAFRKAQKEEERRALERIRQKVEEDKVLIFYWACYLPLPVVSS